MCGKLLTHISMPILFVHNVYKWDPWCDPSQRKSLQYPGTPTLSRICKFLQTLYSPIQPPNRSFNLPSPKPTSSLCPGTPDALKGFNNLKEAFCSTPILAHPDPNRLFVVEVDASTIGAGTVLSQCKGEPPVLHPCAYFSKKLSPAEQNYDVVIRELLAIKLALEEWRHWLEGANHTFNTDHRILEYLREAKRQTALTSPSPIDLVQRTSSLMHCPVFINLISHLLLTQFSLQPWLWALFSGH